MPEGIASLTPRMLAATVSALAFGCLSLYILIGVLRQLDSRAMLLASTSTFAWMLLQATDSSALPTSLLELGAYATWMLVLVRVMAGGSSLGGLAATTAGIRWILAASAAALLACALLVITLGPGDEPRAGRYAEAPPPVLLAHLMLVILALGLLDQVRGNANRDHRWRVKFLALGLFIVFGYDFVLYSDALLFQGFNPTLASVRPAVHALAVPLLFIGVRRNRQHRLGLSISRRLAFQFTALMGAGAYLLLVASAGYYMRLFGGQWGEVLQAFFFAAAAVAFLIVAGSRDVRERLRRSVASNLFEQRYDYREEWQRLTHALASGDPDEGMPAKALRVLAELINSPGGGIWIDQGGGQYLAQVQRSTNWVEPLDQTETTALIRYFSQQETVVDLQEWTEDPERYPALAAASGLRKRGGSRFVLPLLLEDRLWGVVILLEPTVKTELDWEDRDLLRLVARQTASFLAQHQASDALAQSRQLEAFSQMNAFVVHDVKTVVSQLSLMVRNADKHRNNPEFLDDVVRTTRHAVDRMGKLLEQLRERKLEEELTTTDLAAVCHEAVQRFNRAAPRPEISGSLIPVPLQAPHNQLVEVVSHLLQNAVDATPQDGHVRLELRSEPEWYRLIIEDTGAGMSESFIQTRLFAPFESTKGLTGMGIGVYQARQLVRRLGGDLLVRSREGSGTCMEIIFPNVQGHPDLDAPSANEAPASLHALESPN